MTPKLQDIPKSGRTEKYISKHYPEFFQELQSLPEELSLAEKLYWYYNSIHERPICKACGNPVKFINSSQGYHHYCSLICSNNSTDVKNRKKESCQAKFGTNNPLQNKEVQRRRDDTVLSKYGVKNVSQSQAIKDKKKETCLKHNGVPHNFFLKSPYILDFTPNSKGEYKYKCPHPDTCHDCSEKWFEITPIQHGLRIQYGTEPCTRLLPYNTKSDNNSLELFVKQILDSHNIEYKQHDRSVLDGQELDFYIPSKNLAIECNGVYWHSDTIRDNKDYHYNKWLKCKDNNIQLITFWEDQIKIKPDIVRSLILSRLNIYQMKIGARECVIREINKKECDDFLTVNHLQGVSASKVRLGLYHNDELVSVMTFGKQRRCMNIDSCDWEICRFCNKSDVCVVGGASKLFRWFIECYKPQNIITFASHDISNGSIYKDVLGFEYLRSIKCSYWYIDRNTLKRYHRYNFNKKRLVKNGADPNLTEFQIMANTNYLRIYDSGQSTYIWKNPKQH